MCITGLPGGSSGKRASAQCRTVTGVEGGWRGTRMMVGRSGKVTVVVQSGRQECGDGERGGRAYVSLTEAGLTRNQWKVHC